MLTLIEWLLTLSFVDRYVAFRKKEAAQRDRIITLLEEISERHCD